MIDPEVPNMTVQHGHAIDQYARVSPPCTKCGKKPGIYGECWECQMETHRYKAFLQRTDEVLTRVEQDPVFAARLKIVLGI